MAAAPVEVVAARVEVEAAQVAAAAQVAEAVPAAAAEPVAAAEVVALVGAAEAGLSTWRPFQSKKIKKAIPRNSFLIFYYLSRPLYHRKAIGNCYLTTN